MTVSKMNSVKCTVAEMMATEVCTIPQNSTMAEAARVLVEQGFSGLPVVDEMGKCVGVLSNSDFVRRCLSKSPGDESTPCVSDIVVAHDGPNRPLHIEYVSEDRVGRHMSPAVQTIAPDCSAIDAAKYMSSSNIHCLIVTDRRGRPVGVVSALDALKVLVTSGS